MKKVVDDISGIMDIADERIVPMHGCDHRSICRFTGQSSESYKNILSVLQDWTSEIPRGRLEVDQENERKRIGKTSGTGSTKKVANVPETSLTQSVFRHAVQLEAYILT